MSMSDALFDSAESIVHYLKPSWNYDGEIRERCLALVPEMDAIRLLPGMDGHPDLAPEQYQVIVERVRAERAVEIATDEMATFINDEIEL